LSDMEKALDHLPADQRDVIVLVALEGMRYDEAAGVLGISMGTVRSRLSRGRAALREAVNGAVTVDASEPRPRRVK
ncbi:MAG: sigma-70 family RNA polymerase sigma factor, partial [Rhodospirillales bacterium]|nr:sigma-70 family RNA polymerase sigma factor [Rhodospirillales bacterium]